MIILPLLIGLLLTIFVLAIIHFYKKSNFASDRLSELLSALQNFVVATSIVASGIWVIYTFDALNQKDEAELKYLELQKRIEETQSSTIKLDTQIVDYKSIENSRQTGLIIEVTITNKGNAKIEYDLTDKPLKVYKVEAKDDKMGYTDLLEPTLYSSVAPLGQKKIKSKPLTKWVSLTQSSRTLSYFVTVDSDSLYYLVFSSANIDSSNSSSCSTNNECKWFVSKYVYINKK